ncbi:MAG: hypothetical protein IGS03_04435 [Candidatus Sericytochromatia bacterium]|nr:hypothetical protein [Candidatus Sericytochromatia bacterium]
MLCLTTGTLGACRSDNTSQEQTRQDTADTRDMSPEAVVEAMASAFFDARDPEKAYRYWSQSAQAKKSAADYVSESQKLLSQAPENAVS